MRDYGNEDGSSLSLIFDVDFYFYIFDDCCIRSNLEQGSCRACGSGLLIKSGLPDMKITKSVCMMCDNIW